MDQWREWGWAVQLVGHEEQKEEPGKYKVSGNMEGLGGDFWRVKAQTRNPQARSSSQLFCLLSQGLNDILIGC